MPRKPLLTALLAFVLVTLYPFIASAQIPDPVKWSFTSKKITSKTYELHITATIDSDWKLYAQEAGEGPVSTTIKFAKNPLAATSGKVKEQGKLIKQFDPQFDAELKYYQNSVVFVQTVTLKGKSTSIKGSVEFMVSDSHQTLPPKKVDFAIKVGQ